MKSRKIWIVSEFYFPVKVSTGYYVTEIAEYLASRGLEVHVICTGSVYVEGEKLDDMFTDEVYHNVNIHRVFVSNINKDDFVKRLFRLIISSFRIFFKILSLVSSGDRLLVVTNPAFLILMMPYIKWKKKIEYSILVHDIFPENLVAIKKMSSNSLIYKCLKAIYDKSYQKARFCISIGRDMSDILHQKVGVKTIIYYIPTWAENEAICPLDKRNTKLFKHLAIGDKLVFQFAGNLGHAQGIENLLEAIKLMDNPQIHFLFIGGGAKYSTIAEFCKNSQNSNVTLLPFQDRSEQNDFLNACDIAVVTLNDGMYGLGVPSKSYNIMATGKPILFIGDMNSEIALCIKEFDLGWVVEPGKPKDLKDMIESIYKYRDNLVSKGSNARLIANSVFSKGIILDKYYQLLSNPSQANKK